MHLLPTGVLAPQLKVPLVGLAGEPAQAVTVADRNHSSRSRVRSSEHSLSVAARLSGDHTEFTVRTDLTLLALVARVDKAGVASTAFMTTRAPRCLIAVVATAPIGVLGPETCLGRHVLVARQQCLGAGSVKRAVLPHVFKSQWVLSNCHIDLNGVMTRVNSARRTGPVNSSANPASNSVAGTCLTKQATRPLLSALWGVQ